LKRFSHRWITAGVVGMASAGVLAVAAAPSGATLVCPPGVPKIPQYCKNVPPIATTEPASSIGAFKATLNGISGPNVAGGDPTDFFFKWGKSSSYGRMTTPTAVGQCPPGTGGQPYCVATRSVTARIEGLQPCTVYHFQIVSKNPDGTTRGDDSSFTSAFAHPLTAVTVAPNVVGHGHFIKVTYTLRATADVTIALRRGGADVKVVHPGKHHAGTYSKSVKVPAQAQAGKYVVRVSAKSNCGTQVKDKQITVT
jgi:hypothetical protein